MSEFTSIPPSRARRLSAAMAALCVFAVLMYPSQRLALYLRREMLRSAEALGLMDKGRGMGGQIMGYNYYRYPEWVYAVSEVTSAMLGFGAAFCLSIVVLRRVGGCVGATRCGVCGKNIDLSGGVLLVEGGIACPCCKVRITEERAP